MELNRDKIIKALECCSGTTCKVICPLSSVSEINCGQLLINESLAIIKELTEENNRLQNLIQEAQQYNEAWVYDNGKLRKEMKTLKADTAQKMQQRLEERIDQTLQVFDFQISECNAIRQALRGVKNDIYQITKEMLEENNV